MEIFEGRWELLPDQTKGFDEFSDAIGAPKQGREAFKKLVYVVDYKKEADSWKVKAEVKGFGEPKEYVWTPGKEFEYEGLDGSKMKSTFVWDGNACKETHASETGNWTSDRTIEDGLMIVKSTSGDSTMVQKFQKA